MTTDQFHHDDASVDVPPLRVDEYGQALRLLHVHAHPDDESSKGAATTAKYVREGVKVMVVTCTDGSRGSVLNPKLDRPEVWENITEIRRAEMDAARKILRVEQVWLDFVDSGLPEGDPLPPLPEGCFGLVDPQEAAARLVEVIRAFRPHVMTTYDEQGGYPHPDHIMCHKLTMAALRQAADPDVHPELGAPWQVRKVYYHMNFHQERIKAIHAAILAAGAESPYAQQLENFDPSQDKGHRVTTRVLCSQYFDIRDEALRAHATQIDPDGRWFAVPLEYQRAGYPTEDYELAFSTVHTSLPEDDLFAGIAVPVTDHLPDPAG